MAELAEYLEITLEPAREQFQALLSRRPVSSGRQGGRGPRTDGRGEGRGRRGSPAVRRASVELIHEVLPAREVIRRLLDEAGAALRAGAQLAG